MDKDSILTRYTIATNNSLGFETQMRWLRHVVELCDETTDPELKRLRTDAMDRIEMLHAQILPAEKYTQSQSKKISDDIKRERRRRGSLS